MAAPRSASLSIAKMRGTTRRKISGMKMISTAHPKRPPVCANDIGNSAGLPFELILVWNPLVPAQCQPVLHERAQPATTPQPKQMLTASFT